MLIIHFDDFGMGIESGFGHNSVSDIGSHALGLLPKILHHLGPHDAVGIAGIVLNIRCNGQLTPGLQALVQNRL